MGAAELTGLGVAAGVLVATAALGLWWRRRSNRVTPATREAPPIEPAVLAALGAGPGAGARPAAVTLLQFSSAFCVPCRATRQVCAEVAALLDGVRHVEVDAESHLDAVRALGIWRTPTVLILDQDGRIVRRATGVPGKAQVIAAVAPLLPAGVRP